MIFYNTWQTDYKIHTEEEMLKNYQNNLKKSQREEE